MTVRNFCKVYFTIFILLSIVPGTLLFAQNKVLIDSLQKVISAKDVNDTLKILALCSLSQELKDGEPARAIEISNTAATFSRKIAYLKGEAISLSGTANIYYQMNKPKDALEHWFKSIAIYKRMSRSEDPYIKYQGVHGIIGNLISVSQLNCEMGELKNFEKHVSEAKEIMKKNPKEYSRLGWIGIQWAGCYLMNGKLSEAKTLYSDALNSFKTSNDEYGIANTLANLGMLQNKLNNQDSALGYFRQSLALYKKINSPEGQSWVSNLIGGIYKRAKRTDSALYFYKAANSIATESNNIGDQISSLTSIGIILHENGKHTEAITYLRKAYDLSVKHSAADYILMSSKYLAEFNEINGDYKNALSYFKHYLKLNDSLNSTDNIQAIGKLEAQYDFDKQQAMQAARYELEIKTQRSIALAEEKQKRIILGSAGAGLIMLTGFSILMYRRMRITRKQKQLIDIQNSIVLQKNKEITDSIMYAKRIQAAVLPAQATIRQLIPDSFILYKPKDIVAGDFYWLEQKNNQTLVAACDCTGHGVPGAMVSVICNNGLNRSVREHNITAPDEILNRTREIVLSEFEKSDENVNDGMDIALVSYTYAGENVRLSFSGAHNSLWICRPGSNDLEVIAGDKQPIGKSDHFKPYQKHQRDLKKGDVIYLFTDGYKDQFGGNARVTDKNGQGKKFKTSRLKELVLSFQNKSMQEQKILLDAAFESWRGNLEQVDDVCMIGIRL